MATVLLTNRLVGWSVIPPSGPSGWKRVFAPILMDVLRPKGSPTGEVVGLPFLAEHVGSAADLHRLRRRMDFYITLPWCSRSPWFCSGCGCSDPGHRDNRADVDAGI